MKRISAPLLLACGTVLGAVTAPIFVTDVLGYDRIIEWFPESLKFDWGSFLGGVIGGAVGIGLFMAQRHLDIREARRQRKTLIATVCNSISYAIKVNDGPDFSNIPDLKQSDAPGRLGMIAQCREITWRRRSISYKTFFNMLEEVSGYIEFIEASLTRLTAQLDAIPVDAYTPDWCVSRIVSLSALREDIYKRIIGVRAFCKSRDWSKFSDDERFDFVAQVEALLTAVGTMADITEDMASYIQNDKS
ncbi:hypothetical protein TH25_19165 [Thalassospira profundimaris]|uniref:Uncharacterized protein n=1 Tax=Thalassospira profundimaris TaxID=502049 RepID=A0A367WTK0_9PROT|nr:hypothetical protein [Thalassospira profundimaris]RCK44784.1 hypothetical protein TH25_19165 [Thalassospira profundimaris]